MLSNPPPEMLLGNYGKLSLHAIWSYKKRCKILTSPVSYFLEVFIQFSFLNFLMSNSSRFLNFLQFFTVVFTNNCISDKSYINDQFLYVWNLEFWDLEFEIWNNLFIFCQKKLRLKVNEHLLVQFWNAWYSQSPENVSGCS